MKNSKSSGVKGLAPRSGPHEHEPHQVAGPAERHRDGALAEERARRGLAHGVGEEHGHRLAREPRRHQAAALEHGRDAAQLHLAREMVVAVAGIGEVERAAGGAGRLGHAAHELRPQILERDQ
jgi:hypothetical protein